MAPRKRKKQVEEGPFLFSEEEMIGKIEKVTIIQAPESVQAEEPSIDIENTDVQTGTTPSVIEPFSDDRMVEVMTDVLRKMALMDKSKIRLIAFTTTVQGQQGLDLNAMYSVPAIRDTEIIGYEVAAWCYCSFIEAFPNMKDKLQMPYAAHYEKAKADVGVG